jgi:PiT family inorganic phosphate transporter
LCMGIGSLIKGFAVTELLAQKVTTLDNNSGLSSLLTTSFLVMFASKIGLPVSTTHVSSSAIIGSNLHKGSDPVNWSVVRDIVLSWVVTIPGSGILSALFYSIMSIEYYLDYRFCTKAAVLVHFRGRAMVSPPR